MKEIILFLISLTLIINHTTSAEFSTVLDKTMQQFREEILTFQSDTMIRLDYTFFKFYNILYSDLNNTILQPTIVLSEGFNKSCAEFPFYRLENNAARRLQNICDDLNHFFKRVLPFAWQVLAKYYPDPETLTKETIMELIAEDYFNEMDDYLEYVVPIYNQNPLCIIPSLQKFLSIYKKPIDQMIKMNENMIKMVKKGVKRDLKFIEKAISKLFRVVNRMLMCSEDKVIDTFGCISDFVDFDCKKKKSGCGVVYKSIFITLNHFRNIEAYRETYELSFNKIYRAIDHAGESMLRWSVQIDKCIEE